MEYDYLVSSFDFDSFDNISKKQADEYFRWYVSQSETRIDLLKMFIDENHSGGVNFDYSPNSLVPLWKWFEDEILFNGQGFGSESENDFSGGVLKIITDISFYFAEVFIKNTPTIKWGYFTKPKNRMSVNKPVLVGFKADMILDPRLVVRNCAYRSADNKNSEILYNIYFNWQEFI